MASLGGQAFAYFGIVAFLLGGFFEFSKNKQLIEQLFFMRNSSSDDEDSGSGSDKEDSTNATSIHANKEKIKKSIQARQPIDIRYLRAIDIYFWSFFCCCF